MPALPTGLFGFVRDSAQRQLAEEYSMFLREMEVRSALIQLNAPSRIGGRVPFFPSYQLPTHFPVSNGRLELPAPKSGVWTGFASDPALRYLVSSPAQPSGAEAKFSVAGVNRLQLSSPLSPTSSAPFLVLTATSQLTRNSF